MNNNITVAITATLIITSNVLRKNLLIENVGVNTVFIGSNINVNVNSGYPIYAGEIFKNNDYVGNFYGIVATSTNAVNYLEES